MRSVVSRKDQFRGYAKMAPAKGKGFLGNLADKISHELLEDDGSAPKSTSAATAAPAPAPAPAPTSYMPGVSGPAPTVASGTMPYTFGTGGVTGAPEPLDPKALEAVQAGVFTNIGNQPSRYLLFMKMYENLGKPADLTVPLHALQVMDPSLTAAAILQDIQAHLKMLDDVETKAGTDLDGAASDVLGGADKQIADLQAANVNAQSEIERHQKEMAERIGQITQLQTQRANDDANISRAKAHTAAAVSVVRSQLQSMQTTFSNLPA
jgi:hypothetical protein